MLLNSMELVTNSQDSSESSGIVEEEDTVKEK